MEWEGRSQKQGDGVRETKKEKAKTEQRKERPVSVRRVEGGKCYFLTECLMWLKAELLNQNTWKISNQKKTHDLPPA